MNWYESHLLLALANAVACLAIAWACICRLNTDICRRLLRPRARYSLLLAGALTSGLQPILFGSMPGAADFVFALAVLAGLLLNLLRWNTAAKGDPLP